MEQQAQPQQQVIGKHNLNRNICACDICKTNCKIIPGYLVFQDILNIYNYYNPVIGFTCFIQLFFLASPGAIVMKNENIFRIPTIVPTRNKKTNHCIFFTSDEKCSIHHISPFGCRYFNCKQTEEEADNISKLGLNNIINDLEYKKIWITLNENDLIAESPEKLREKLNGERNKT